ncbi:N-acetyltransferase family protein [Halovulum sp. GXIMD14794]
MELRKATYTDAEALARIHRAARRKAMPWLPVLHSPEGDRKFFGNTVLSTEDVRLFEDGGQVIGFIATKDDWVNHLYVDQAHWRRGVGSRLLEIAKADAPRLQLWTFQGNDGARQFYAAHEFTEVEFTDGRNNEEKTPDVRLVWTRDG